jgi:hypothetical protein
MDKTLADYIKRIQGNDEQKVAEINDDKKSHELTQQNIYNVFPEDTGEDRYQNPYGQH